MFDRNWKEYICLSPGGWVRDWWLTGRSGRGTGLGWLESCEECSHCPWLWSGPGLVTTITRHTINITFSTSSSISIISISIIITISISIIILIIFTSIIRISPSNPLTLDWSLYHHHIGFIISSSSLQYHGEMLSTASIVSIYYILFCLFHQISEWPFYEIFSHTSHKMLSSWHYSYVQRFNYGLKLQNNTKSPNWHNR